MFDDIYGRVAWVYICHGVLVRVRRQTCYSQFSPSMMRFSGLNSGVQTPQKALLFTEPLHWFQPNPFEFFLKGKNNQVPEEITSMSYLKKVFDATLRTQQEGCCL